jgi:hypothetical protein
MHSAERFTADVYVCGNRDDYTVFIYFKNKLSLFGYNQISV